MDGLIALTLAKQYTDSIAYGYKPMKSEWLGSNLTTAQAVAAILADSDVHDGDAFIGEAEWSDLNTIGLINGEVTGVVGDNKSFMLLQISSSDTAPHLWYYNSYAGAWRPYCPLPECTETTDGTYSLQCTVASGIKTYAWVAG